MMTGMLVRGLKSPSVGYSLKTWPIDCSPNHCIDAEEHDVCLMNPETLCVVESVILSPAYPINGQRFEAIVNLVFT